MKIRSYFLTALLIAATASMVPAMAHGQNVNQRLRNQNRRIHQGVKDGQLSRNQVDSLRSRDANIRSRELRDRARDDGHLTARERQNFNRSLNRNSRTIHRDRHDPASRGN